jgi:hypothetical protein
VFLLLRHFHISCCCLLFDLLLFLPLHHGQEQERWWFFASFRRQAQARADSPIGGLRRLGVLGGGVLLRVRGLSGSCLSQGIVAEVWTYIRAVERAGLEGSDESEYSSDEENSVAELPELFQLKCPNPASEARPHLNGNNPSIPRI